MMAGNKEIASHLNTILGLTLAGINQYFLHARLLKHMGVMKLADFEYRESLSIMKHADKLVERILFLSAMPNLQEIGTLAIGEDIESILKNDLALAEKAERAIKSTIALAQVHEDLITGALLEPMLKMQNEHMDYIRAQLSLIADMGAGAYMQTVA